MKERSTSAIHLVGTALVRDGVSELLDRLGVPSPVCMISAGWQESEGTLLSLPPSIRDLELHQRAAEQFGRDPDLSSEHSAKQRDLMRHQAAYNLRLSHAVAALDAVRQAHARAGMESDVWDQHESDAMTGLRALDRQHVRNTRRVQDSFAERWNPQTHGALGEQRDSIASVVNDCGTVLIAGGHIAVLLNRLRLFGVAPMLKGKTVVAWGAGAMAMAAQVMLYDDRGPLGARVPEVLGDGLGLIPKTVLLPNVVRRLDLEDSISLRTLAARAAPRRCIALGDRAELRTKLLEQATPEQGTNDYPRKERAVGHLHGEHAHQITPSGRLRRMRA